VVNSAQDISFLKPLWKNEKDVGQLSGLVAVDAVLFNQSDVADDRLSGLHQLLVVNIRLHFELDRDESVGK